MKPKPMPLAMEYVMGMPTMVRNAGNAEAMSLQSISPISVIMRYPTTTRAPQVAELVTMPITGARNAQATNAMPMHDVVQAVRRGVAAREIDARTT